MTPGRLRLWVTLLVLVGVVGTAGAESSAPVPDGRADPALAAMPSGLAAPDVGPDFRVTVTVLRNGAADPALVGSEVELVMFVPPHEILETRRAPLDGEGRAEFRVPVRAGAQVFARFQDGRQVFSDTPLDIGAPGSGDLAVSLRGTTTAPNEVVATSLVTIVEPWEGFLAFTQIWTLSTTSGLRFHVPEEARARAAAAGRAVPPEGAIEIPMPKGAKGIQVIQPAGETLVIGESVWFFGDVDPDAAQRRGPVGGTLMLRFSVKSSDRSDIGWEQPLRMDVAMASVIVPQASSFKKHPRLDVSIEVPVCGGAVPAGQMCFAELGDQARDDIPLRPDLPIRVARGGVGRSGDTMVVMTRGWPVRPRWPLWGGIGAGFAGAGLAAAAWARERRRRGDRASALEWRALASRRVELLDTAESIQRAFDRGEVTEFDHQRAMESLREQLAAVQRRLRELSDAAGNDARDA